MIMSNSRLKRCSSEPGQPASSASETSLAPQRKGYMRAAIYTSLNKLDGENAEEQLVELRTYAAARHWNICSEYEDLYTSGSKDSRPELNRLLADADRRRFDVVLCWKADRFGHSLKHFVNALTALDSHGVAFVSVRDNLDLSTPTGRLMFQIVGVMAVRERSLIQERVKAGLRKAKRKGKTLGRPPRIINFDEMARLRVRGASFREIAKAVAASPATVRARLLHLRPWAPLPDGKRMGRPSRVINVRGLLRMREQGFSVCEIAKAVNASPNTVSRRILEERLRSGLPSAKRGRPPRVINVDQMMRMYERGAGIREIAKAVGVSAGTVRTRLLQSNKSPSQTARSERSPKFSGPDCLSGEVQTMSPVLSSVARPVAEGAN
jgi:DNA invertase Pin-like site-specific DNA recombinase/transposase-like protein